MGADATRITAADFVTPPEFRGRSLALHEAGRIGGVRLELVPREDSTGLGACYQQVPLRVLPPFRFAGRRPILLYLLNPTAGLLDGDGQLVRLTARAGTSAVVVGQSATRVHPCPNGFATQQWRIEVEANANLVVLPGPLIPFADCRYYQRVEVELEPDAGFLWGDIGFAGRYQRGALSERFRFAALVQDFQVNRSGRLVFRDRSCWRGPWDDSTATWHLGDGTAWGSLFATSAAWSLQENRDGAAPWFSTAAGDSCLRCVGRAERVTAHIVRAALNSFSRLTSDPFGDDLAPVHWFSGGCSAPPTSA